MGAGLYLRFFIVIAVVLVLGALALRACLLWIWSITASRSCRLQSVRVLEPGTHIPKTIFAPARRQNVEVEFLDTQQAGRRQYRSTIFCDGLIPLPGAEIWCVIETRPYRAGSAKNRLLVAAIAREGRLAYSRAALEGVVPLGDGYLEGTGCGAYLTSLMLGAAVLAALDAAGIVNIVSFSRPALALTVLAGSCGILWLCHWYGRRKANRLVQAVEDLLRETYPDEVASPR